MTQAEVPSPLRQSDYEAIEAAVMETEKGRWFLAEYARRNRAADTVAVLGAISSLERILKRERRPDADRIRLDIGEMKEAIERTKIEIAQIKHDGHDLSRFDRASNELDAIVTQTEAATSDILGAAEKLQEIAWTMREGGIDGEICDAVENLVMGIYTACSFQDLTGQRTQKVVHVLRYLESRIDSMISIWGMESEEVARTSASVPDRGPVLDTRPDAHLLNGPALDGQGIDQTRVDGLLVAPPSAPEPALDLDALDAAAFAFVAEEAGDAAFVEAHDADAAPDADFADAPIDETAEETATAADDAGLLDPAAFDRDLAKAAEAMDEAIDALREVSAVVRPRDVPADDPLARLDRAERQSLFG